MYVGQNLISEGTYIEKALNLTYLLNLTYPFSIECYYGAF